MGFEYYFCVVIHMACTLNRIAEDADVKIECFTFVTAYLKVGKRAREVARLHFE